MKFISHRGNLNGPEKSHENSPSRVDHVLNLGFDCEIDLWAEVSVEEEVNFSLGHDEPQYLLTNDWLAERQNKLWIHCKNFVALSELPRLKRNLNFFWHENDAYTLTSHGFIWVYPGNIVPSNGIFVLPERTCTDLSQIKMLPIQGFCSDFIAEMR